MKVMMERVIKMGDYETQRLAVELSDTDMTFDESDSISMRFAKMRGEVYRQVLQFLAYHNYMNPTQAKQEMERFRTAHRLPTSTSSE